MSAFITLFFQQMELEPWVPERITIIVLMKLDRILWTFHTSCWFFQTIFPPAVLFQLLGQCNSPAGKPSSTQHWLARTWSWKFLPLLLIFSSGPSFRINLQYQPSGGGWCIPHTPQIYALVWLPLIQSDSQSSPGGFSHTDGFDFGATQVWSYSERSTEEKSHMYNENILKGFWYHSTTKCSSLNEVMLSFWIHIGKNHN